MTSSTILNKTVALSNNILMPVLGLGLWKLREPALRPVIEAAIKLGVRHFDGAAIYENEAEFGKVIGDILANPNEYQVSRKDLFIVSKLWNTNHAREDVFKACEKTLCDLNMEYIDLFLIHWPFSFERNEQGYSLMDENGVAVVKEVPIAETWGAMEELVQRGKVRAIGVSNFTIAHLEELKKIAKIMPTVNQVELHPYLPQPALLKYCQEHGIQITGYSPLGSGKEPSLLENPIIKEIAAQKKITPAQVAIAWGLTRGEVVIPKTSNVQRLQENFLVSELDADSMKRLDSINFNYRYCNPVEFWKRDCFDENC